MEKTLIAPEKKQYIRLSSFSKKLYQAQRGLGEALESMAQGNSAASIMRLNQANQIVREVASSMYAEKKEFEKTHPELKAEAIAFGKAQQQKREQQQSY